MYNYVCVLAVNLLYLRSCQGELIEVTDFSSPDWWTGLKQTVRQDDSTSTNDHHGGRKRLQTQSFEFGVFPANHVKTILVTPLSPNALLKKGTCVVMQNQASVRDFPSLLPTEPLYPPEPKNAVC